MTIKIGDSFELLPKLLSSSVDLIFTDPPYDFSEQEKEFLQGEFLRIVKPKGQVIVFSPPENQWIQPADQYGFWIKPISTKNTSKSYSRFVEMIFFYGRGYWDNSRHWSQYTNVFTEIVDDSTIHPFRKPPALVERIIKNHSRVGDLVLDPFCGSGVVGEVCRNIGRFFVGFEKSEEYLSHYQQRGFLNG